MDNIGKLIETLRRLKAERPEYFKWLGNWSWVLTALSGLSLLLSIAGVYTAPEWLDNLLVALTGLFGGAAVTSSLAVKNPAKANIADDGPGPGGEPLKPPTKP